jgi:four helix bundle protein
MARSAFEELEVFKLAERLSDAVWPIVGSWPRLIRQAMGDQLLRAADGVGANIAEGAGRGSFADNRRAAYVARGELFEAKFWLRRAYRRGLLPAEHVAELRAILDELAPRLNAYIRSLGRRIKQTPPRRGRIN